MAKDAVTFETKGDVNEAAVTLPGGRTVRVHRGKTHTTSDPNEIAALDGAESVKRAKRKRSPATPRTTRSRTSGTSTPTNGAQSSAPKED